MSEQDAPDEHKAAGEPAAGDDAETETPDPPADLVERVTEADPEAVARDLYALREEVDDLRERLDEREERVEELESSLKRTKADFQNYKKRQERRREQERRRATEDLVERLLDVRDNLARALDVEGDEAIDPAPGDEVDPQRHEVLMRVDADHPEGAIADVHRPGYEMGERVLRPAQVTVSEGTGGDGDNEDGEGGSEA